MVLKIIVKNSTVSLHMYKNNDSIATIRQMYIEIDFYKIVIYMYDYD